MRDGFKLVFSIYLLACCSGQMNTNESDSILRSVASIPLPGVNGRIDHMAYNIRDHLVYIAALGNNTLEVVDLRNKKVVHSLSGLDEPQGIRYIPENNSIFVANGGDGECKVFNAQNYQLVSSIKLGDDADNVRYSSTSEKIYIGYGEGGIAVIDAKTFKQIADIKLPAHPESFQPDEKNKRIFVNIPNSHLVDVIDMDKNSIIDSWEIKEASSNFPMALDTINNRLFIGCRHPAKLLIINAQTGKTIASLDTDSDTDDIFFDSTAKLIFMSCGGGYIDVFRQINKDKYEFDSRIKTRIGARTSFFIPELHQLIVAAPSGSGNEAQLMIYNYK